MTRRQFFILVAVLAALALAGAWIMQSQRTGWKSSDTRAGQKLVPGLTLEDVSEIALRNGTSALTLARRGAAWVIPERGDFPADVERVRDLLLKLAELKIVQSEPLADTQRARLDLAEPGSTGAGTRIDLRDGSGKSMARLLLGKQVTARTAGAGLAPEQGIPTGRYVIAGDQTGNVLLVSDPLGVAETKAESWLTRDLIQVERTRSVTAAGYDGKLRFALSRDSETADWKLGGGQKPDLQKAQDVVNPLQGMSLADVVADPAAAAAGLKRPLIIKALTFDDITYSLRIGDKTAGDRYFVSISVAGEPPATRPPAKAETAESKSTEDKAFAERRARLVDKLKREKGLQRWNYLVARSALEGLLREHVQLLPEKKPGTGKKS